jgi:hypothetical protein
MEATTMNAAFKKYEDAKNYAQTSGIAYPYDIKWHDPIFVTDLSGNTIFAPKEDRGLYIVVFDYSEPEGC